jgi:hypothetical protein
MKRREDCVRLSRGSDEGSQVIDGEQSRVHVQFGSGPRERDADALVAPTGEWADVLARMHGHRTELRSQSGQLLLRVALANHDPATTLLEGAVKVLQAFEQELSPRAGAVTPPEQAPVKAEHGHHHIPSTESGCQGRMIVES